MSSIFQRLTEKGSERTSIKAVKRKIIMTNRLNFLVLGIVLVFMSFHFSAGQNVLGISNTLILLILGASTIANFKGYNQFSRSLLSGSIVLAPFLFCSFFSPNSGLTILYIPIIAAQFIIFDLYERNKIVFFISASVTFMIIMEVMEYNIIPGIEKVSFSYGRLQYLLIMIMSMVGLALSIYWLVSQNSNVKKDLIQAKNEAEKTSELKTQFLSMISHEIRTPLNGIIGITEILMREELPEKVNENVKVMKFSANNLLSIVNDVLDFSKIEAGKVKFEEKDFSVKNVLLDLRKTLGFRINKKNLKFHVDIEEDVPPYLIGDAIRLNQVLLNLLDNALKFTNKGHVSIKVEVLKRWEKKVQLLFSVSDSGIGIHEESLKTIFESFTQATLSTTREYGGTGLGITIARNLVTQQGGTINVKSKLGVGTTFSFNITYVIGEEPIVSETKESSQSSKLSFKGLKLLLVEDNMVNQFVTKQLLNYLDISYNVATNGEAAIKALRNHDYDLILMDYHMPIMDGIEATRHIRDKSSGVINSDIPIIIVTADVLEPLKDKLKLAGANDYLLKPFDQQSLVEKIHGIINDHDISFARENTEKGFISPPKVKYLDISYVEKIIGSDIAVISELLGMVINKTPELVLDVKEAKNSKDYDRLLVSAHNMKSNFKNIGVFSLSNTMANIENIARKKNELNEVNEYLEDFEKKFQDARKEIEEWISLNMENV